MKAIILAGGKGTRLLPYTTIFPKPLVPVGERPILDIVIRQLAYHGFDDVVLSVGHLAELIQAYFHSKRQEFSPIKLSYVREERALGTAGPVKLVPNLGTSPFLVMNGDVLTKLSYTQLLQHHERQRFDATLCVREDEHRVPFGVIETEDELITNMVEKPTYRYKINTGIYVLSPEVVASVKVGQRIDMPTLLEQHRQQKKRIGTYTSYDYWLDIGQMKDYQKAQRDIEIYFKSPNGSNNE